MLSKNFIFLFLLSIFAKISKLAKIALEILLHLCLKRMQVFFGICWLILYVHVCTFPCTCALFRVFPSIECTAERCQMWDVRLNPRLIIKQVNTIWTSCLWPKCPHLHGNSFWFQQSVIPKAMNAVEYFRSKKISGSFETAVKAPIERCESLNFSRCLPRPTSGTGNVLIDKSERWYRS